MTQTPPSLRRRPRLLCVGVAGIDYVASLSRFPSPDDKVRSRSLLIEGGGNAANTACAVAKLGPLAPAVDIATAVGDDANSLAILKGLGEAGVGTPSDAVERYAGSSAFTYVLTAPSAETGESTRTCVHQPADGGLTPEFAEGLPLEGGRYDAVHFDVRHAAAAVRLAARCADGGIPYSVDVERPREGLEELLSNAAVVICNARYCDAVLGGAPSSPSKGGEEWTDAEVAERLRRVVRRWAPRAEVAVTTLGGRGSCLIRTGDGDGDDGVSDEESGAVLRDEEDDDAAGDDPMVTRRHGALWCPAWPGCDVVDTTGAGDAFQGGFLAALWSAAAARRDRDDYDGMVPPRLEVPSDDILLARALRVGTRVAGRKVERPGARGGLPSTGEDAFLRREFEALLCRTCDM